MPDIPVKSTYPVPFGPFDLWPQPQGVAPGRIRLSQQFAEVITSGGTNKIRLSQQYLETIHSGGTNKIRLSQQYLEIVTEFGSPPPGKSGGAPGHVKPPKATAQWLAFRERERTRRSRGIGRFVNNDVTNLSRIYLPGGAPAQRLKNRRHHDRVKRSPLANNAASLSRGHHLAPNFEAIRVVETTRTVRIG